MRKPSNKPNRPWLYVSDVEAVTIEFAIKTLNAKGNVGKSPEDLLTKAPTSQQLEAARMAAVDNGVATEVAILCKERIRAFFKMSA
jgi:hypothetical protein